METSALEADIGRIIIGSILTHEGKMVTFRQDKFNKEDMTDDGGIAVAIREVLEQHHITVGWYSKGFDIPFLCTRLNQNGHRTLNSMLHLDPCWYMKGWRGLKPRNGKLSTAAEFFGLEESKMVVPVEVWAKARAGNKKAIDILAERCESDVRLLKDVTDKILDAGLVRNITSYP